jgi:DNA-binding protein HU-beta
VTLVGFGTFSVGRRKPRKGKNPRTGQPMNVAGGRTPRFKPSPELKRAIR